MAKAGFYAVAKGRAPGIYASWEDCEAQVKGYAGAKYKKFKTLREAEAFVGVGVYVSSSSPSSASISTLPTASRLPVPPPTASTSLLPVLVPASGAAKLRQSILNHTKRSVAKRRMSKSVLATSYGNVSEEGYDVVYADGACKGNGQLGSVAGIGVWWGPNDPRNIAERCPGKQTNNRAELIAIVRVLEEAPVHGRPLMIKTDSTYSIKCLREWHQKWAHNNWQTSSGGAVLNAPLIRYILSLLQLRELAGFPVMLVYVKGHAGIEGNEGADRLANIGAMLPERAERDWEEEREKVEDGIRELRESVEVSDKAVQVEPMEEEDEDQGGASVEVDVDVDVHLGTGVAVEEAVVSEGQGGTATSTAATSAMASIATTNAGGLTTTSTSEATTSSIATSASTPARGSTTANVSSDKSEGASIAKAATAPTSSSTTTSVPALVPDLEAEAKAETKTKMKADVNGSDTSAAPVSFYRIDTKGKGRAHGEGKISDALNFDLDDFGADCLLDDDELEKEMAEA